MERKKLLWLSHLVPYPPKGGVLQRSFNLLREISKDFDVYLFCFNQETFLKSSFPDTPDPLSQALRGLEPYTRKIQVTDIPYSRHSFGKHYVALKSLLTNRSYTQSWLQSTEAENQIKAFIADQDFDAVHFDTISLGVYRHLVTDTPAVLNHHNIESRMLVDRSRNEKNIIKKLYFQMEAQRLLSAEKKLCPSFNLNITCSEDDARELNTISPKSSVDVVPNGVDIDYFYPRPNDRPTPSYSYLVFAGGLSWYPNLDAMNYFVDEIWPELKSRIPSIRMSLVGRNPPKKFIDLSERDPNFVVHGFVDDVRPYLWDATAYICPIRDGGGTKLKILDALAVGVPLIAQNFSCKGIAVEPNRHVLFASSPKDYVDQVEKILSDSEMCNRLTINGPKFIKDNFSYKNIGRNYSALISGLIKGKSVDKKATVVK
jgi:glycosyltransferase involved in cell wall biosynthesis